MAIEIGFGEFVMIENRFFGVLKKIKFAFDIKQEKNFVPYLTYNKLVIYVGLLFPLT